MGHRPPNLLADPCIRGRGGEWGPVVDGPFAEDAGTKKIAAAAFGVSESSFFFWEGEMWKIIRTGTLNLLGFWTWEKAVVVGRSCWEGAGCFSYCACCSRVWLCLEPALPKGSCNAFSPHTQLFEARMP